MAHKICIKSFQFTFFLGFVGVAVVVVLQLKRQTVVRREVKRTQHKSGMCCKFQCNLPTTMKKMTAKKSPRKELSRKSIRINKTRTNRARVCLNVVVAVVAGAATVCDDARSPSAYVATSQSLSMAAEAELSQALLLLYSGSEAKNSFYLQMTVAKNTTTQMRKQMQAQSCWQTKVCCCYFDTDFLLMKLIWDETELSV